MEDVLVRPLSRTPARPPRSGQVRILEAVIATIILLIAFTAFYFMLYSSEKFFKQEAVDLNRLSYNTLMHLVESGVVERAVSGDSGALVKALQSLLPPNVFFNLTIVDATDPSRGAVVSVSNAVPTVFEGPGEVASATITYTSREGKVYMLVLKLALVGAV
jgi:hypothetical protein